MVQLLKYKSTTITPKMIMVIAEHHGKMDNRDLASKIGVTYDTLKNYLSKLNYPSRYRERKFVKWEDKPTRLVISGIRNGDYLEARKAALKAVEKFKVKKRK